MTGAVVGRSGLIDAGGTRVVDVVAFEVVSLLAVVNFGTVVGRELVPDLVVEGRGVVVGAGATTDDPGIVRGVLASRVVVTTAVVGDVEAVEVDVGPVELGAVVVEVVAASPGSANATEVDGEVGRVVVVGG